MSACGRGSCESELSSPLGLFVLLSFFVLRREGRQDSATIRVGFVLSANTTLAPVTSLSALFQGPLSN
jgi:hypothetical protein